MTEKAVKAKAREVNDISLDYHLSHALCASNVLVKQTAKTHLQGKIDALKGRLRIARDKNDTNAIGKINEEIRRLNRLTVIYVEYIDNMAEDGGRVVWINSQLIISLPKKLADNSRDSKGALKSDGVRRLREIMAHELGHIVLNIDELLDTDSLQGDKFLSAEAESDAWVFARELLDLRHERNVEYFRSGAYKNL